MSKPAARVGDMHVCPMFDGPKPHVGGPVMGPGAPTVLIGGMPAAVMGTMCTCTGPPDTIVLGSMGVLIGGKPAARMGDMCAHGGTIVAGCPTVLIGEMMPGPPPPPTIMAPIMLQFEKDVREAAGGDAAVAARSMEVANTTVAMQQAADSGASFVKVPAL
ncbi:MAG: PAAR domain-containing protein [Flavobacteriales bacterium]|nr:PAAR domain-containing protein [Flavobacteriales bacterium]